MASRGSLCLENQGSRTRKQRASLLEALGIFIMSESSLSKSIAAICVFFAAYISWLLISNIGIMYSQVLDWSSGSSFVAIGVVAFNLASILW